jgi:hypothetical protein
MNEEENFFGDTIFSYTITQAEEDGVLASTDKLLPNQPKHLVSHITGNLIDTHGYDNVASIIDLCNFIGPKIREIIDTDTFGTAYVEGPRGNRFKVFFQLNEIGRWTIMLPEDY